jgi:hypothetical protein
MIRVIGLWLVGCSLCVTPVAAEENMYDGPTAIKPLTVTPQAQHSAPSIQLGPIRPFRFDRRLWAPL